MGKKATAAPDPGSFAAPAPVIPEEVFTDTVEEQRPGKPGMVRVHERFQMQRELERDVMELELQLKTVKAALRALTEEDFPGLMDELGLKKCVFEDGVILEVKEFITASIAGENLPSVVMWLRQNHHEGIVTRDLSVSFGKGMDAKAAELLTALKEKGYEVADKQNVNTGTFKALVRELIAKGVKVPVQDLGVFVGRRTEYKLPKKAE